MLHWVILEVGSNDGGLRRFDDKSELALAGNFLGAMAASRDLGAAVKALDWFIG